MGALVAGAAGVAAAHTTGQAFVLLLPTYLYILGGALVVAASFVLVALVPWQMFARLEGLRWRLGPAPLSSALGRALSTAASLVSLAAVLALVAAGLRGSRDPLVNPLPLVVWTVWWIGFTYLHALCGDLWAHLNPWSGLYRVTTRLVRRAEPLLPYPAWAGCWPAVIGFLAFAWFELVHPAPADPGVLAGAVAGYLVANFAGVFVFGERAWLRRAEAFSVFFRVIAWLAPLGRARDRDATDGEPPGAVTITLPGLKLLTVEGPGPSGVAFILAALSSVSFDGLSRTFTWVALLGQNPLEYPGRSALVVPNTLGLLGTFAALGLVWAVVARLARALARPSGGAGPTAALVLSIVPIAFGYHIAHYLPVFVVDVQYALRATSDPFALGWDLLGTRELQVVASLTDPGRVYALWHTQVAIIVAAHVAAVAVGHALVLRLAGSGRASVASQVPVAALMIGYMLLGLWLLSTPTVG